MTDREKLIELLIDADDLPCCTVYEYFADYLIANGVTVQKHGRWKRRGRNLGECSECGEVVAVRHRYCPNCGAKMDLEVENAPKE